MTRSLALLLSLACVAVGVFAGEAAKRSLTVFEACQRAISVAVPTNANELAWMVDLWVCTDRALRSPPENWDSFPHIQTLELDDRSIRSPSQYGDGCEFMALCTRTRDGAGRASNLTNLYTFNFYTKAKGVTLGVGSVDFLYFKRDTNNPPQWFIFAHQDSGDVLLFERMGTNAPVQPKR